MHRHCIPAATGCDSTGLLNLLKVLSCLYAVLANRVKQDLYAAMSAKQSTLQLLQEREQQLTAVSSAATASKQQLEHLQR